MKTALAICILLLTLRVHAQQQSVLVEVFTNSHCPLCPPAHAALSAYDNTTNGAYVRHIFYHMTFPYPDDQLAQANTADPAARNQYYGNFSATPVALFDGALQTNGYSGWAAVLDNHVAQSRPVTIALRGSLLSNGFSITATVAAHASVPSDLVMHFVLVENSEYVGRNGVSPQNFVMRKLITNPNGDPFTIASGDTVEVSRQSAFTNVTIPTRTGVVVFIQSAGSKQVIQSEYIPFGSLTSVSDAGLNPATFHLGQNYPNPFNPSTIISYDLPLRSAVSLKIFNLIGQEVAILAAGEQGPGSHSVVWDAMGVPGGAYFYRLQAVPTGGAQPFVATRKLMLVR